MRKRLIKTPKLYFAESGLLTYLLGFPDWTAVIQNAAWGAIWENLVIGEMRKQFLNRGARPPCWFWRTVQSEEIDLLIERGPGRFLAVECKTSAEIEPRMLKGFAALEQLYGPKVRRKGAVVCAGHLPLIRWPRRAVLRHFPWGDRRAFAPGSSRVYQGKPASVDPSPGEIRVPHLKDTLSRRECPPCKGK